MLGIVSTLFVIMGALIVLFIILSDLLYPICLAMFVWITDPDTEPELTGEVTPKKFSAFYTSIFMYVVAVVIGSKDRMGVFLRMGSMSAVFISAIIIAVIILCCIEISKTNY